MKNLFKSKKINCVATILLLILCPVLCIYLSNYILRQGLVVTLKYLFPRMRIASIGYLFMLFVSLLITLITRRVVFAYIIMGGISLIGGASHYFKTLYRGEALFPADLVFLKSTGGLISQFNIQLTPAMYISIAILLACVLLSVPFKLPDFKNGYRSNIILSVVVCFMFCIYGKTCLLNTNYYKNLGFYENMNPVDIYYTNTFHTAFLFYVNSSVVMPPEDYGREQVESLLTDYTAEQSDKPDIVFIMMESWFNPDDLFGLKFDKSINENYKKLSEKSVYGNLLSFKYGGGTADIEFNVLNQLNTTFFTESLSYMNVYGNNVLPSFVNTLKTNGYNTFAMHAYTSELYNRVKAYKNIGFDEVKFMEDFVNQNRYGSFISDVSQVNEVIYEYERLTSQDDAPVMLYAVSMQNHMYMSQENIDSDRVYLADKNYTESFTDGMGVVASYMRQTDLAVKRIMEYFETVDREVVVVLFGDHQSYNVENIPDFSVDSLNEIENYSLLSEKEKYIKNHSTPFIIWSNKKDMGGQYWPAISPHYIWALASNSFNLPGGEYEKYLYNAMDELSVQNEYADIYCDKNGNILSDKPEEISASIYMLNYDRLFGKKYSLN